MVSSFVCSGVGIHVLQFLQRLVQMTPNYVRWGNRLSLSSAEEETSFPITHEVSEHFCDTRVKINLTKTVGRLEPLLYPSMMNLLIEVEGYEIRRDVLIDLDTQRLSDSQTRCTAQDKNHSFAWLLPSKIG